MSGTVDEAVLHQRLGQAGDDVVPPGDVDRVVLERHEVLGGDRDMGGGHRGDRAFGHVDRHGDAVVLRHVADLLGLEDAAAGEQVRVDDRDAAALEQRLEALLQVDVLAGADRHRGRLLQLPVLVGVLPGDHVLEPGRHVFLDPPGEPDAVLQRDVADVVDGERNLHADHLADLGDVLLQQVEALVGEVQAGEGMEDVVHVVDGVAGAPVLDRLDRAAAGVDAVAFERAGRRDHRARDIGDLHQPEIHLEEGEAEVHALLEALAGLGAARHRRVGVAIDAHLVAELAAEHLVDRHAVGLAGEIPQRDLDRRDAAALPAVAAELLDAAEQAVDVAGVLAEQPALQHQRVGGAGAVAHLAEPDDALVGVDLEQRRGERRADDLGHPHVGDAKLGRPGVRVDPIERLVGPTRLWHDLSSFWWRACRPRRGCIERC